MIFIFLVAAALACMVLLILQFRKEKDMCCVFNTVMYGIGLLAAVVYLLTWRDALL